MRSKHEKKNVRLDKAFYQSTHEYKNTHFRAWKKGKTWIYASAVIVLFAGNFANFANPTFLSAFGTITAHAAVTTTAATGMWGNTPISVDTAGNVTVGTVGSSTATTTAGGFNAAVSAAVNGTTGGLGLSATTINSISFVSPVTAPTALVTGTAFATSMFGWDTNLTSFTGGQYFDVSGVTSFQNWFTADSSLQTLTLTNWNVSKSGSFSGMFSQLSNLTSLDLSSWTWGTLKAGFSSMFNAMTKLQTLNLTGMKTPLSASNNMFYGDSSLTSLIGGINNNGDSTTFDVSQDTSFQNMFYGATALSSLDTTNWYWGTGPTAPMTQMFYNTPSLQSVIGLSKWNVSNVTSLSGFMQQLPGTPNSAYKGTIDLSAWTPSAALTSTANMFNYMNGVTAINIGNATTGAGWKNTTGLTNAASMFAANASLATVDTTGFYTGAVQSMGSMFMNDIKLSSVPGITTWNMSNVTSLSYFMGMTVDPSTGVPGTQTTNTAWAGTLDLSSWGATLSSKLTTTSAMFKGMAGLSEIDVNNWTNTSALSDTSMMFLNDAALSTVNATGLNTSADTTMSQMFMNTGNLSSIQGMTGWNVSNVTTFTQFLSEAGAVGGKNTAWTTSIDLSSWNITNKTTAMNAMFEHLEAVPSVTLSNAWDTSNVTTMSYMFKNDIALNSVTGLSNWNVQKVTNFAWMFGGNAGVGTALTSLDLSGWVSPSFATYANYTAGAGYSGQGIFAGSSKLSSIKIGAGITAFGANAGLSTPLSPNNVWAFVGTGTAIAPAGPMYGNGTASNAPVALGAATNLTAGTYVWATATAGTMNFAYGTGASSGNPALSGFTLPTTQTLMGLSGTTISYPSLPSAPAGFSWNIALSGGATGNYSDSSTLGSAYSQLQSALITFANTNFTANWTLTANTQTATFTYVYPNGTTVTAAPNETGTTGAIPADPTNSLYAPATGYSASRSMNTLGYSIQGPDGNYYSTLAAAEAANPYNASNNNYNIYLGISNIYTGLSTFYKNDSNFGFPPIVISTGDTIPVQYLTGFAGGATPTWDSTNKQWIYTGQWSDSYSTVYFKLYSVLQADGTWRYMGHWNYDGNGLDSASTSSAFVSFGTAVQPTSIAQVSENTKVNQTIKIDNGYTVPSATVGTDSLVSTSIGALTSSPTGATATMTSNADGTINFSADTAGVYKFAVTYTDSFGNPATSNDTVTIAQTPVFNLQSKTITTADAAAILATDGYGTDTQQPTDFPVNFVSATDQSGDVILYNNYSHTGTGTPNAIGANYSEWLQSTPGVYTYDYTSGTPTEGKALYWHAYTDVVTGDSMEMFAYSNTTVYVDKTAGRQTQVNHPEVSITVVQTPTMTNTPIVRYANSSTSASFAPTASEWSITDENGHPLTWGGDKIINGQADTPTLTTNGNTETYTYSDGTSVTMDTSGVNWNTAGDYTATFTYSYWDTTTSNLNPTLPKTVTQTVALTLQGISSDSKTIPNQ